MRAREALAITTLKPMERVLLGILADHAEGFRPSVKMLADNLYGNHDKSAIRKTKERLSGLETAGMIKRHYQFADSRAQEWTRIEILATSPETGTGGMPESGTGGVPESGQNGPETGTPKAKRASKANNKAARPGGKSGEAEALVYLAELDISVDGQRLDDELGPLGLVPGEARNLYLWFVQEREDKLRRATEPVAYFWGAFPGYAAENLDALRESEEVENIG